MYFCQLPNSGVLSDLGKLQSRKKPDGSGPAGVFVNLCDSGKENSCNSWTPPSGAGSEIGHSLKGTAMTALNRR